MSCERYQRLLHLNRSGEISKQEADDLRQHLRLCEKCSLEFQRIQRGDEFIDRLGSFSPAPTNAGKLTADILRRVRAESTKPRSINALDRVLDFFLIPGVRYSAVVVISFVGTAFVLQSLILLDDISNLENRMVSLSGQRTGAVYSARSETLREVAQSAKAQPLTGTLPFTVTNGRIQVPAKIVDLYLNNNTLKNLPVIIGTSALRVDPKTLEKIVGEIRATVELIFHTG
ncbi:MAG: zf-HC2 domain-containing protein [Ignavibacteria bacterium]|nr:zf-HC2 domain-containing protein [Ignavibacteria bacterium]